MKLDEIQQEIKSFEQKINNISNIIENILKPQSFAADQTVKESMHKQNQITTAMKALSDKIKKESTILHQLQNS
jgi:seryl-tRNA synthetase